MEKSKNSDAIWNSILEKGGSGPASRFPYPGREGHVQDQLRDRPALAARTAGDRTPYIDQATSLNLFIPADVDKWDLLMLHYRAWELGIKSLYYLRSKSVQRAGFAGGVEADNTPDLKQIELQTTDYDECLACQ
jgi:ribonucleoside-diphosphate reductase alpha chain